MSSDFDLEQMNALQKSVHYMKTYGIGYTLRKVARKVGLNTSDESAYMAWCKRVDATRNERKEQKSSVLTYSPLFTIVAEDKQALSCVKNQTYLNYDLLHLKAGFTLSQLVSQVKGEYVCLLTDNILLREEALYEVATYLQQTAHQQTQLLYFDEDNTDGKKRFRPYFKPEKSLQLLLNFNYLGGCFILKTSLLQELMEKVEANSLTLTGNHWYALALEAMTYARKVKRLPRVLFSNRVKEEEKDTFIRPMDGSGEGVLNEYIKRHQMQATVIKAREEGFYHLTYELEDWPLVSVIIPNKDHIKDLSICLNSLKEVNSYTNYEVIIAENNSTDPLTFAYYKELEEREPKVKVVTYKGDFNYSAINNFAASFAKGSMYLFLNNDTKIIHPDSLKEMVSSTLLPHAGACGAMLYYEDNTIQHGGIILGMGGFAAHALWSLKDDDAKYYPYSITHREMSGGTGACLMVKQVVFDEVKGMGEEFVVALNDVDLCFKILDKGYHILFNPYAKLYHFESKSRGYEDTSEKQERFRKEIDHLQSKWKDLLEAGDPYYNPNLTLHRADYSMDI